jgi:hypothetical protein
MSVLRLIFTLWAATAILAGVTLQAGRAADADPCTTFKWDVSRELAVMKQTPHALTAAVKPGGDVPELTIGTLYILKLSAQGAVTFVASPAKARASAEATAGIVRFRTDKGGRYRVSITSGHWLDVVDHGRLVQSLDFQGHVGCEQPRKIVEYELPAGRALMLQLSGSKDTAIVMAITAVDTAATK